MIITNCQRCGKEMQSKYKSWVRPFCSYSCSNHGKRKGKVVTLSCETCGKDFELLESTKRTRERNGKKVKYCSARCSGMASRKSYKTNCKNCGKEFETTRYELCSRKCASDYRKKTGINKRNGYWLENGYKVLYTEDGRGIKEHIKVMQDHIGRLIKTNEVVHHINEDRLDNRIENLQLMTRGEHSKLHRELDLQRGKELFKKVR